MRLWSYYKRWASEAFARPFLIAQTGSGLLAALPRLAGISQRQKTRAGNFGSRTLRALSAPVTGSPAGSSKPTCTSTLA